MTVKDIAISCAVLLQADDIEQAVESETADGDPDVKALVKSINLALGEIASDGFSESATAKLNAENGVIPFSAFSVPLSAVLSVRDKFGAVDFSTTPSGIKTPSDGEYTVEYSTFPAEKTLDSELELAPFIGRDDLTYLAARNFCLITGRTDEASIWDQRYTAEIEKKRIKRRAKLPTRHWE